MLQAAVHSRLSRIASPTAHIPLSDTLINVEQCKCKMADPFACFGDKDSNATSDVADAVDGRAITLQILDKSNCNINKDPSHAPDNASQARYSEAPTASHQHAQAINHLYKLSQVLQLG